VLVVESSSHVGLVRVGTVLVGGGLEHVHFLGFMDFLLFFLLVAALFLLLLGFGLLTKLGVESGPLSGPVVVRGGLISSRLKSMDSLGLMDVIFKLGVESGSLSRPVGVSSSLVCSWLESVNALGLMDVILELSVEGGPLSGPVVVGGSLVSSGLKSVDSFRDVNIFVFELGKGGCLRGFLFKVIQLPLVPGSSTNYTTEVVLNLSS